MLKRMSFVAVVVAMAAGFTTQSGAQQPPVQQPTEQELMRRATAQPADLLARLDLIKLYISSNRLAEAESMLMGVAALVQQQRRSSAVAATPPSMMSVPAPGSPVRIGGGIVEPKKIRHVPPVYPPIAQAAQVQGFVIIEIIVATDGTVADAKVLRSQPLLDQAALDAVRQWVFTPTLVNNVPVPVVMTVTVNFTLG